MALPGREGVSVHRGSGLAGVLAICVILVQPGRAQTGNAPSPYESPTIRRLSQALSDIGPRAAEDFWARVAGHVPLIEPVDGEDGVRWITFLWRGDVATREVSVGIGDVPTPDPRKWSFRRVGESDVWFKTDRVPKDARFAYLLKVNGGPLQLDPLNTRRFGGRSVAELPDASPQPWVSESPGLPLGNVSRQAVPSRILNQERTVGVYTPPGYTSRDKRSALLLVLDGEIYGNSADALVPTPRVLDNLLAARKIPPTIAILVNNIDQSSRDRDLRCSSAFGDFLATELVPWIRARYSVTTRPSEVVIAGSSDGGLAALCAAHQYPKVFGNVLAQSANVFYSPNAERMVNPYLRDSAWLTRRFVTGPLLRLRFYLEVGVLEAGVTNPVAEHRRLKDVLEAKGYEVTYSEFAGGHDYVTWRNSLGDGLIALLGSRTRTR